jgi:hypothetical protein
MNRIKSAAACILLIACLSGCSGLKHVQGTMVKFDESVHSVSIAQMNFFRAVQTADCNKQFYTNAYDYAIDRKPNFDLTGACRPTVIDNNEIEIRKALMDAITLYADKLMVLATSDDKALDANSQKAAQRINALAKQHGFTNLSMATGVESAIIAISEMALDQKRFEKVKEAAREMAPHLTRVVAALKAENTSFAYGIASKTESVEGYLREVVAATHKEQGQRSFFQVVEARRIMQSINPFGPEPVAAAPSARNGDHDPQNFVSQLNASLDSVVNANQAIASAGTGGIIAAVSDLSARAKAAQSMKRTLDQ